MLGIYMFGAEVRWIEKNVLHSLSLSLSLDLGWGPCYMAVNRVDLPVYSNGRVT